MSGQTSHHQLLRGDTDTNSLKMTTTSTSILNAQPICLLMQRNYRKAPPKLFDTAGRMKETLYSLRVRQIHSHGFRGRQIIGLLIAAFVAVFCLIMMRVCRRGLADPQNIANIYTREGSGQCPSRTHVDLSASEKRFFFVNGCLPKFNAGLGDCGFASRSVSPLGKKVTQ